MHILIHSISTAPLFALAAFIPLIRWPRRKRPAPPAENTRSSETNMMTWKRRSIRWRVSCLAFMTRDVLKLLKLCPQGADVSKKHTRQYCDGPQDNSIPKPTGTAGKGGGLGYNLQKAM